MRADVFGVIFFTIIFAYLLVAPVVKAAAVYKRNGKQPNPPFLFPNLQGDSFVPHFLQNILLALTLGAFSGIAFNEMIQRFGRQEVVQSYEVITEEIKGRGKNRSIAIQDDEGNVTATNTYDIRYEDCSDKQFRHCVAHFWIFDSTEYGVLILPED